MTQKLNLIADQGANATFYINVYDANGASKNLSGYTSTGTIKKHFESANSISMDCTPYSNGLIVVTLDASVTANMAADRYVYDIEINYTASNTTNKIQSGIFTLVPNV